VKRKIIILILFLIILVESSMIIGGFFVNNEKDNITVIKQENSSNQLNYLQYQQFAKDFSNIKLSSFDLIEHTIDVNNIDIVEKDITFNRKNTLTLSGDLEDVDETVESILYKNKKNSITLRIDLIFTSQLLENNLLYISSFSGEEFQKHIPCYRDMILTYKNIIIKITVIDKTNEIDSYLTTSITKEIMPFLNNFNND
jgi:hypothetical protein